MSARRQKPTIYQAIGKQIRLRRWKLGLSQSFLAISVGLARTSVVNLEAGRQRISIETLYLFAAALDVAPTRLLPKRADVRIGRVR